MSKKSCNVFYIKISSFFSNKNVIYWKLKNDNPSQMVGVLLLKNPYTKEFTISSDIPLIFRELFEFLYPYRLVHNVRIC